MEQLDLRKKPSDVKYVPVQVKTQQEQPRKKSRVVPFLISAIKTLVVVFISVTLTTLTIDATDNVGKISDSMIGNVWSSFLGEQEGPCPENMVHVMDELGGFCIDAYEVSAGEGCAYPTPVYKGETQLNLEQEGCFAVSKQDKEPWRFVSQHQAIALCAKSGKRLASAEQWYAAALGTPDSKERCNIDQIGVAGPHHTGDHNQCVSYVGAYDMVGNVWEWVYETVQDGVYDERALPKEGYVYSVDLSGIATETGKESPDEFYGEDYFWMVPEGVMGIFRGGYWGLSERAGVFASYAGMSSDFAGTGVGFRCVK